YWSPISSGITVASHLRAHLSDRAIPRICTATPIGKMDWHTSGWAVEPVEGEDNLIWIRTPYTPDYFKSFAPLADRIDNIRVNAEGTIDIQYFANIGDEDLFLGKMPPETVTAEATALNPPDILEMIRTDACLTDTLVDTTIAGLFRQHETRVELTVPTENAAIDYILADTRITDVIIATENDVVASIEAVEKLVARLATIPHVNAVRLRSLAFNYSPEVFTRAVIDRLATLNRLSIVGPLRLEIETRFYRAENITASHDRIVRSLNNRGITVYANTPLLSGINNNAATVQALSFRLRQAGIEFHHLYVAGLPHQEKHNKHHPVQLRDIVDIATRV
ncbi:MAG: lysine 2,3-aminomutase, partial [Sulfitobacter sp.]|nr:lysine 2,3-aminomutase [Sulfitobacter sp.]